MLLGNLLAKHESGTECNGGHAGNGHNGKAGLRKLGTGIGGRLGGGLLGHDGVDGQGIRSEGHGAVGAGGLVDDLVLNTLGLVIDVDGHLGVGVSSTQVVGKLIRSLNLADAGNLEGADLGKALGGLGVGCLNVLGSLLDLEGTGTVAGSGSNMAKVTQWHKSLQTPGAARPNIRAGHVTLAVGIYAKRV